MLVINKWLIPVDNFQLKKQPKSLNLHDDSGLHPWAHKTCNFTSVIPSI